MSSDSFPWMSEYEFSDLPKINTIKRLLLDIGMKKLKHMVLTLIQRLKLKLKISRLSNTENSFKLSVGDKVIIKKTGETGILRHILIK